MRETAFGIVAVFLLFTISLTSASAQSANTCGINFVSGNSVTYGNLQSGATSSEQTITLSNPGTVAATLSANGTNWVDGAQTNIMNVGNTKFSNSSGTYSAKTPLTLSLQNIGALQPSVNTNTYWQLQANLLNAAFTGNLTQALNFRVSCDGGGSGGGQTTSSYPDGLGSIADGTVVGGVTTMQAGKIGNAWSFDGTDDHVQIDRDLLGVGNPSFTISFWANPTTAKNYNLWFSAGQYVASPPKGFYLYTQADNSVLLGDVSQAVVSGGNVPVGTYSHIVVSHDGTTTKIFVNGNQVASQAWAWQIGSQGYIRLGTDVPDQASLRLNGKIDDLSIWSRALSTSEISTLYNSGNGIAASALSDKTGLKAYYDFEQQSPWLPVSFNTSTIVNGMSANGNVLSASGVTGGGWASYIRSNEYINPAQGGGEFYSTGHSYPPNFAFGFEKSPFNQYPTGTYQNANYGFHTTTLAAGNHIYEKTTSYNAGVGSTSDSQTWQITMDKSGLVKYYIDSNLVRTSSVTTTNDNYYIESSFSGSGSDTASFYYRPNPVLTNQAIPTSASPQTNTPTFSDDFTSYADTTAGDLAYPTTDAVRGRINPITDVIDLSLSASNQLDEIHHDFGAGVINDTSWVLRFKLDITEFTKATVVGHEHKVVFQLASGLGTSEVPTDDAIGLNMKMSNAELGYYGYRNDAGSQATIDTTYDPAVHTVFVELIRSSATTGTAKLFSDSGYSVQLGNTANIAPEATITDLRYFKVHLFTQSTNGQLIGTIDDIKFWNGVSQVP